MAPITIYTKPGCPYCQAAKDDMRARNVEYKEVSVPGDARAMAELAELTGGENVVPVIVDGDKVQIGFGGG
jgi:glutaredoxin 3